MGLLLLDSGASGAVIDVDITADFVAFAIVRQEFACAVAADITADFSAAATGSGGTAFIIPEPGYPNIAIVTQAG